MNTGVHGYSTRRYVAHLDAGQVNLVWRDVLLFRQ